MRTPNSILIVEDNESWQYTLKMLLEGEGYEIAWVSDYSGALDKILRVSAMALDLPVCVVDLRLAGSAIEENLDGLGLLAVCKMRRIPSIVVSGFLIQGLKDRLHDEFGVIASFDKDSFAEQEFLTAVRRALASPHLTPEFHTKLQKLVDTVIEYYIRAHRIINDKQRERMIDKGRPSIQDEASWRQQISKLDQTYSTVMEKLRQASTIDELDKLHPEIVRECTEWVGDDT